MFDPEEIAPDDTRSTSAHDSAAEYIHNRGLIRQIMKSAAPMLVAAVATECLLWWLWGLTLERWLWSSAGLTALLYAWLIGRYDVVGIEWGSVTEGKKKREWAHIKQNPWPKSIAVPAHVSVGIVLVVAATPLGIGRTVAGPVRIGFALYDVGRATWEHVLTLVFVVAIVSCFITGVVKHDRGLWVGSLVLTLILCSFFTVALTVYWHFWPHEFHQVMHDLSTPYTKIWHWLT